MATETKAKSPAVSAEDMAHLRKAVDDMIQGVRDPEAMDRPAKEMDEGREEIRQRLGDLKLAVELTNPDSDE